MKFKYVGFDKDGKKIKGFIYANDIKEAKFKLKNITLLSIKEVKSFSLNFAFSISNTELSKLFLTLGLYLKSIPLINSIKLTKNQFDNHKIIKFLDFLEKNIKEGNSFYHSLISQKIIKIPEFIINAIKVGEESGKLSIVLIEMSKFLKNKEKLFSKTKQALMYPFFIIIVAIIMISFMLTFVVPKIVKVFSNLNQNLPETTMFVINASIFIKENYLAIIAICFLSIVLFIIAYKKTKFRFIVDSLLIKIPLIKNIIISKELGRFSYLVYILVNSGVNYITAVKLASNTIENKKIKSYFDESLKLIMEGKKLSTSLLKTNFNIDKSFIQAIAIAEETGEIEEILKNLSEIYFEENQNKINMLLSMIEPILIILIGSIIGFIITSLLLPIFNMNLMQ